MRKDLTCKRLPVCVTIIKWGLVQYLPNSACPQTLDGGNIWEDGRYSCGISGIIAKMIC